MVRAIYLSVILEISQVDLEPTVKPRKAHNSRSSFLTPSPKSTRIARMHHHACLGSHFKLKKQEYEKDKM